MAYSCVQGKAAFTASTSIVLAFDSNNAAGNLLIAAVRTEKICLNLTVTDTRGNTWLRCVDLPHGDSPLGGAQIQTAIFYCLSAGAGANTVTATDTDAVTPNIAIALAEYNAPGAWGYHADAPFPESFPGAGCHNHSFTTAYFYELIVAVVSSGHVSPTSPMLSGTSVVERVQWNQQFALGDRIVNNEAIGAYTINSCTEWEGSTLLAGFYASQSALTVDLGTITAGVVDQLYVVKDGSVSGGAPPYTISISAGELPPGLQVCLINDPNDTKIVIAGKPLKSGTFAFTVTVTDSLGATGTDSGSITVAGSDLNCPCGTVTKVELTSVSDYHYSENTTGPNWGMGAPGAYLDYGFPSQCCEPMGCLFNFCLNTANFPPLPNTPWTNQEYTSNITSVLTNPAGFNGDLAAMLGSLSVQAAACQFGGNWDGRNLMTGDGTYAQSLVLTILDLFVTVTYSNGHKLILRPQASHPVDGTSSKGKRYGSGIGVQLWQWGGRSLMANPWDIVFYNFPAESAPAVCPSLDCLPIEASFDAACSSVVSGVSGYPVIFSVSAYGGTAPYTFAKSGVWPAWLNLDTATGFISGTLGAAGTYSVSVRVTDSAAGDVTVTCSVTVAEKGNGCESGFTLEKLVVTLRPDRHGPVRGAAQ